MVYTVAFLLCLSAVLFMVTVALEDCTSYNDSRGDVVLCVGRTPFCCGKCSKIYCCNNLKKKISQDALNDCLLSTTLKWSRPSPHQLDRMIFTEPIIVFFVFVIIVFIIVCCSEKRFRNRQYVMPTATVTTTQIHPQGSQYSTDQPGSNNQMLPTILTGQGQLYVLGPPPSYQEAAGYPVPFSQAAYDGGQALYSIQPETQPPLPTEYTSPPPAYNPAHMNSPNASS